MRSRCWHVTEVMLKFFIGRSDAPEIRIHIYTLKPHYKKFASDTKRTLLYQKICYKRIFITLYLWWLFFNYFVINDNLRYSCSLYWGLSVYTVQSWANAPTCASAPSNFTTKFKFPCRSGKFSRCSGLSDISQISLNSCSLHVWEAPLIQHKCLCYTLWYVQLPPPWAANFCNTSFTVHHQFHHATRRLALLPWYICMHSVYTLSIWASHILRV